MLGLQQGLLHIQLVVQLVQEQHNVLSQAPD
jgi:hypothetical protein